MAADTAVSDDGNVFIAAIVLITAALVFYTAGVWSERRVGRLRWRHAVLFGTGLALDASGTAVMAPMAADSGPRSIGDTAI